MHANAKRLNVAACAAFCLFVMAALLSAQSSTFTSGSDGTDGALDYSSFSPGTYNFTPAALPNPLPATHGNVYNFTTITIPAGITVILSGQYLTGPIYWLAQGAVDIEGTVDLSGGAGSSATDVPGNRTQSIPGAGGFAGGAGGNGGPGSTYPVESGWGPGGGAANCNNSGYGAGGQFTGNQFLVPLIGGSGGGGTQLGAAYGAGGGAGGGAILIASSVSITVNGTITAAGGSGAPAAFNHIYAGGGSGGAIRLAAPTIAGKGSLLADLGSGGPCQTASAGLVRVEANNRQFTGTVSGNQVSGRPYSTFAPDAATNPQLTVVSVAGVNVTSPALGQIPNADVTFSGSGPVPIVVNGANIPPNTQVSIDVFCENGPDLTGTGTLAGTLASTTATITVNIPPGYSRGYITATWTAPGSQNAQVPQNGVKHVPKH